MHGSIPPVIISPQAYPRGCGIFFLIGARPIPCPQAQKRRQFPAGLCKMWTGWRQMVVADGSGRWRIVNWKMQMTKCGWKNVDGKIWIEKCRCKNVDGKILNDNVGMIKAWWGEINCDVDCFLGGSWFSIFLGREKWNICQRNSIITLRKLLFPLMAGSENICEIDALFGGLKGQREE